MLPKENRLKKNKHFNYIYKHGKAVHGDYLTIIFSKTKFKPMKIGFTVSKKIGKSVVRSKVKRRLREAFKLEMPFVNSNYNYVFVCREGIDKLNFLQLRNCMKLVLKKANLYEQAV